MPIIINAGSVDDIRCRLKLGEAKFTVKELMEEIKAEVKGKGRKSIIDMLQAAIKRKNKETC